MKTKKYFRKNGHVYYTEEDGGKCYGLWVSDDDSPLMKDKDRAYKQIKGPLYSGPFKQIKENA